MTRTAATRGALAAKQVEIDAGATPVDEVEVTVADAAVSITSRVYAAISWDTPTGKDADDVPMDSYLVNAEATAAGQMTIRLRSLDGPVHDTYRINYFLS